MKTKLILIILLIANVFALLTLGFNITKHKTFSYAGEKYQCTRIVE